MKPFVKRLTKTEDYKFKWVHPVKVFPPKYGPTKIRIFQDPDQHSHLVSHKLNTMFAQYNEFIKLVFKHKKDSDQQAAKVNINYIIGLGKCLGVKVNKDTFSDTNIKTREMFLQMKEKLAHFVIKRIA